MHMYCPDEGDSWQKTWDGGPILTNTLVLYYLFYVSHSQKLISRCPGSYDTPFTDQLPPQPPYLVC